MTELKPHIALTEETARKAFRTKALSNESKRSHLIKLDAQYKTQLHQVFPLYTWIIDFAFDNKFLLCVEANTRYAVIYLLHRDATRLVKNLEELTMKNTVKRIIGDYDKVFTSNALKEFCESHGITYEFKKSAETNHIWTSILDRVVRTFRDMLFNLKVKDPNILDMRNIVEIYNKTHHQTLSKILGQPTTPEGLHRNEALQLLLIRRLRGINWSKTHVKSYVIDANRKVFVRAKYGKMDKRRAKVENDIWTVVSHQGALYTVKNKEGETKVVPRRDLRVCNVSSVS